MEFYVVQYLVILFVASIFTITNIDNVSKIFTVGALIIFHVIPYIHEPYKTVDMQIRVIDWQAYMYNNLILINVKSNTSSNIKLSKKMYKSYL